MVAFGMIGSTLSGVTFVSVPGTVGIDGFGYLQITIGYMIGYAIVAYVLLPIYYKMHLTSIYTYLQERMGEKTYKAGAFIFIVSKLVGATARVYLAVNILQLMVLDSFGVPFWPTTLLHFCSQTKFSSAMFPQNFLWTIILLTILSLIHI